MTDAERALIISLMSDVKDSVSNLRDVTSDAYRYDKIELNFLRIADTIAKIVQ